MTSFGLSSFGAVLVVELPELEWLSYWCRRSRTLQGRQWRSEKSAASSKVRDMRCRLSAAGVPVREGDPPLRQHQGGLARGRLVTAL